MSARVVHLDTHVVAWLYAGLIHHLSDAAREVLAQAELQVSPAVLLELDALHNAGILHLPSREILPDLGRRLGLSVAKVDFLELVQAASAGSYGEDPYDQLICAHARLAEAPLLTKDARLHASFPQALW